MGHLIKEYLRRVNQLLNEMDASIDQYPLFSFAKILGKAIDKKYIEPVPNWTQYKTPM